MNIGQELGPLFDVGPRELTKPPHMVSVVHAIVSRVRAFGYVYVAPSVAAQVHPVPSTR